LTMEVYLKNVGGLYELADNSDYVETDDETITLNSGATLNDEYKFRWLKNLTSVLASVEDGEITDAKLSDTVGQIKPRVVVMAGAGHTIENLVDHELRIGDNETDITGKASKEPTLNLQSGTTYTLVLADADKIVELNDGTECAVTIPLNASVTYPIGTNITIVAFGAGVYTVKGATGVILNGVTEAGADESLVTITARYDGVSMYKRATDEWVILGAIG